MFSVLWSSLLFSTAVLAVQGGQISQKAITYTAGVVDSKAGGTPKFPIAKATYEYTGYGAAESSIEIEDDGTLIYAPAFANNQIGYLTSNDTGKTWDMVVPAQGSGRTQPMFNIHDGRYFFWTSNMPGMKFSYSDDKGKTWKLVNNHLNSNVNDWVKIVSGKPVSSKLKDGNKILYWSAPSVISVPVSPGLGPTKQAIYKSIDKGATWQATKGNPTLIPVKSGGACDTFTAKNGTNSEFIIWSNGLIRPNGTVMFGVRRCRSASVAISDDEGETWRWSDVPGSSLVSYSDGLLTWVTNGNVLTAEPLSQDANGNLYFTWVQGDYTMKMAKSTDGGATWSKPIVVSVPGNGKPIRSYHPIVVHHPSDVGRAAIAYYGSTDEGATWNGYVAETGDIAAEFPVFSSTVINEQSQPLQANVDKIWDTGYRYPYWDLIEFAGLRYHPKSSDLVASFTRKMCSGYVTDVKKFDVSTCKDGWDFKKHDGSAWQGFVGIVSH